MKNICTEIAKGGFIGHRRVYSQKEFAESTIAHFEINKQYSKSATLKSAVKAGIKVPVKGLNIPMNLDGTFGRGKSESYSEALTDYFRHDVEFKQTYIDENDSGDSVLMDGFLKCLEIQRADQPRLIAEPRYQAINPTDREDQIIINLYADIDAEDFGTVLIDLPSLQTSLTSIGCRLDTSNISPLIDGNNTIIIFRQASKRNQELTFQIKTNKLSYQTEVIIVQRFEPKPELIRDIGTSKEVIQQVGLAGSNEFTYSISNDKNYDTILRVSASFQIYGIDEKADLYLYGSREEQLIQLLSFQNVNWNIWYRQEHHYNVDIPFHRNSPLTFKVSFQNWSGQLLDMKSSYLGLTFKY